MDQCGVFRAIVDTAPAETSINYGATPHQAAAKRLLSLSDEVLTQLVEDGTLREVEPYDQSAFHVGWVKRSATQHPRLAGKCWVAANGLDPTYGACCAFAIHTQRNALQKLKDQAHGGAS